MYPGESCPPKEGAAVSGVQVAVDLDEPFVIDRRPSERYPIYTRANVGEINPLPVSPLTYTTQAGMLFDLAWRRALVRFGAFDEDDFDPDHPVFLGIFYGYSYLNLSVQRVFGVRMPGASPDVIDASFFGTTQGVPPYQPDPRDQSPEHTQRVTRVIGEILSTTEIPALDQQHELVTRLRASRPDHRTLSNEQSWDHARPVVTTTFAEMMEEHMFITSASTIPIGLVQGWRPPSVTPGWGCAHWPGWATSSRLSRPTRCGC